MFVGPTSLWCGLGSSVGIVTDYRLDGPGIEFRWGRDFPPVQTGPGAHPASCKMGTGSFQGVNWLGRAADHSPPSSAAVMEQYSYTSTHPLGHTGPVTGSLYLLRNLDAKNALKLLTLWPWSWTFKFQHTICAKCDILWT